MSQLIKIQYVVIATLVAVFAANPATLLAQTVGDSVTETAAIVPISSVVTEVEMERRLNKFRSEYLDHRADSITWGLTVVTILFAIVGLVVAIIGFIGFKNLRNIEADASKRAVEAGKHATEASKYAEETKTHRAQAEKDALAIRDVTSKEPDNPEKAKQVERAVKASQQAPAASPIDKAIAMAYSLQKGGETEKALEKWRSIAHLMEGIDDQVSARAWFSVGHLLYLSKNLIEAISAYDQAIRLAPSNSTAYSNRGIAKMALEQQGEAIEDFDRAILLDPNNSDAYSNRGGAKGELEQYEESIKDCNQAILIDPSNHVAYNNRGSAKTSLKQYEEAIKDYNQAIFINSNIDFFYKNRGETKSKLRQYAGAIKDFDDAIRLNRHYSVAYYNRGVAKVNLNCVDEAWSDFQNALHLARNQGDEKLISDINGFLQQIDNPETE